MPLTDETLRYHVRLDGLALATLRDMASAIDAALDQARRELARRVRADAPFTFDRLVLLRSELVAARAALRDRIDTALSGTLTAVTESAHAQVAQSLRSLSAEAVALEARFVEVPVEVLAAVKARPFDGQIWTRWGTKLADDTVARLESELRQAAALGEPTRKIGRRFARVSGLSRASAEKLARTAVNHVGNAARVEAAKRMASDVIKGWRFVATLDGKTSAQCRTLDQREFGRDDPDIPAPPRHPNCRSVLVPVTKTFEELGIDAPELPEGERPAVRGGKATRVKASTSYPEWFARQPPSFQVEVLGPTRFKAYRRGVPLEGMATYNRPLTIDELRRLYPQAMKGT